MRGIRGLGDIDVSDDSVTMGSDDVDDLSDLLTAQNTSDVEQLDIQTNKTQLTPSSSGFNWSAIGSTAGSLLKSLFGGSAPKPSGASGSQLTAAAAAAQAAQTRNMLLIGGAVVVVGGAILLARRRS